MEGLRSNTSSLPHNQTISIGDINISRTDIIDGGKRRVDYEESLI